MIRDDEPPIRSRKGKIVDVSKLLEENKNLKRLLKMVKNPAPPNGNWKSLTSPTMTMGTTKLVTDLVS